MSVNPVSVNLVVVRLAAIGLLVMSLGACRQPGLDFAAVLRSPLPQTQDGLQQEAARLGAAYDRKPGNKTISLRYAQVLRLQGNHTQAAAVLQRAAVTNLNDPEISAAYGKALADVGQLREAAEVLALAHSPDRPNWQVLSAQGTVADQMGQNARAQELYLGALKIAPGEPTVLSNLGLSYALTHRLADAERVLTEAAAHPRADDRVRANLAMVRSLRARPASTAAGAGTPNAWTAIKKAELAKKASAQ